MCINKHIFALWDLIISVTDRKSNRNHYRILISYRGLLSYILLYKVLSAYCNNLTNLSEYFML